MRSSDDKSSRNVDSMRRVLIDSILSQLGPSTKPAPSDSTEKDLSASKIASRSAHSLNDGPTKSFNESTARSGLFSRISSKSAALAPYSSDTFERLLKRWVYILGWCTQTTITVLDSEGVDSGTTRPFISLGKVYSCLEELFECLPVAELAKWFDWIMETQEWFANQTLAATELVFALRTFKVLLMRLYNNGQSHRFGQLAGKVLMFATTVLPFYHASGINRRGQINGRRYPILLDDVTPIYGEEKSAEGSKPSNNTFGRNGRNPRDLKPKSTSIFENALPFITSTAQASVQHRNTKSGILTSKTLTKTSHAMVWETLQKFRVLSAKMNDVKDSPRIDANLVQIEKSVLSVMSFLVNYETTHASLHTQMQASKSSTFLTMPFATHVELMSPSFRLQIAVHILIFLRAIERPSTAPLAGVTDKTLSNEGVQLINNLVKKVEDFMVSMITKSCCSDSMASSTLSPMLLCESVLDMMDAESAYVDWKFANCPDFFLPLPAALTSPPNQNGMDIDVKAVDEKNEEIGETSQKMGVTGDVSVQSSHLTSKGKRQFYEIAAELLPKPSAGTETSQSAILLHHSLMDFAASCKRRKERPIRDGFVGASNQLREHAGGRLGPQSHQPRYNFGSPSFNALFNSPVDPCAAIPSLDDALGGIASMASSWRSRRVIRAQDNLTAYAALSLSSSNKEGEPFDIESFVSASNLNFPSSFFIPKPPPTPVPEAILEPEPTAAAPAATEAPETMDPQSSNPSKPSTPHPPSGTESTSLLAEEEEDAATTAPQETNGGDVDIFEDDLSGLL